jgi:AraC family transcriptional regulator of arabinose operon
MTRDLRAPLAVSQLAMSVNLSASRLAHLFRADTGCAPARFLRNLRLDQARALVEETTLSIKEIMAHVGINDPSHFCRAFQQRHGAPPRRLRSDARSRGGAVVAVRRAYQANTALPLSHTARDK